MTHLLTSKNPMSEARRNAVHGPLVTADVERRRWIAIAALGFVTGVVLFMAFAQACGELGA